VLPASEHDRFAKQTQRTKVVLGNAAQLALEVLNGLETHFVERFGRDSYDRFALHMKSIIAANR
jgi:hypothetical protein